MHISDQLGREYRWENTPKCIVSLVPSITELLFDLGLQEQVVGVTKFCVHPENSRKEKTIVGGTKNLRMDTIRELKPDLILANKEENNREDVLRLAEEFPVFITDVSTVEDALEMIMSVGRITDRGEQSLLICHRIIEARNEWYRHRPKGIRTLYLIWREPWMCAGADTFIHHMMEEAGLENVVEANRYPKTNIEEMRAIHPQLVMLSSEPYPFSDEHLHELQQELPDSRIILVDGEMFSWYGSRMQYSYPYFSKLMY